MRQKKAFTLVELLIVLALMLFVLMLSVGQLHFIKRGYARSELDGLYQACLYMQRHAMMTGKTCSVNLDVDQHRYTCNDQVHQLALHVKFGMQPGVKGPPSSPNKILTKVCTFKNNCISCSKDGVISAGTIYITNTQGSALYALTASVAPYSYLRKYRYAGKWQLIE